MGKLVNAVTDVLGIGPASKQISASKSAAAKAEEAKRDALAAGNQAFEQQQAYFQPFQQAGVNALNKYQGMMDYKPFSMQDFQADPGYGFRLSEGNKALERQAAARGGLISGAALKAAQGYGQQMASQEYQNAFSRYQSEFNTRLRPYENMLGVGYQAAGALSGYAGQRGAAASDLYMTGGANAANAMLQQGNIRASQYKNYGEALGSVAQAFGPGGGGFQSMFPNGG